MNSPVDDEDFPGRLLHQVGFDLESIFGGLLVCCKRWVGCFWTNMELYKSYKGSVELQSYLV